MLSILPFSISPSQSKMPFRGVEVYVPFKILLWYMSEVFSLFSDEIEDMNLDNFYKDNDGEFLITGKIGFQFDFL